MDRERFRDLSKSEIARSIAPEQVKLLREFFGTGLAGALSRSASFVVPAGLSRDTLEKYAEIARRQIRSGLDASDVQAKRLELCERALREVE